MDQHIRKIGIRFLCLTLLANLDTWVEHIVHIDGVTGSSPVATTTVRLKTQFSGGYFMHNIQNGAIIRLKIAKKRDFPLKFPRFS